MKKPAEQVAKQTASCCKTGRWKRKTTAAAAHTSVRLLADAVGGDDAVGHHRTQLQAFLSPPLQLIRHGFKLVCNGHQQYQTFTLLATRFKNQGSGVQTLQPSQPPASLSWFCKPGVQWQKWDAVLPEDCS